MRSLFLEAVRLYYCALAVRLSDSCGTHRVDDYRAPGPPCGAARAAHAVSEAKTDLGDVCRCDLTFGGCRERKERRPGGSWRYLREGFTERMGLSGVFIKISIRGVETLNLA